MSFYWSWNHFWLAAISGSVWLAFSFFTIGIILIVAGNASMVFAVILAPAGLAAIMALARGNTGVLAGLVVPYVLVALGLLGSAGLGMLDEAKYAKLDHGSLRKPSRSHDTVILRVGNDSTCDWLCQHMLESNRFSDVRVERFPNKYNIDALHRRARIVHDEIVMVEKCHGGSRLGGRFQLNRINTESCFIIEPGTPPRSALVIEYHPNPGFAGTHPDAPKSLAGHLWVLREHIEDHEIMLGRLIHGHRVIAYPPGKPTQFEYLKSFSDDAFKTLNDDKAKIAEIWKRLLRDSVGVTLPPFPQP